MSQPAPFDLGDPSGWCDSRCERCPMLDQCAVGRSVLRTSRAFTGTQDNPGAPHPAFAVLEDDLQATLALLGEVLDRDAIDAASVPDRPRPAAVDRAEDVGVELLRSADVLAQAAMHAGARDGDGVATL